MTKKCLLDNSKLYGVSIFIKFVKANKILIQRIEIMENIKHKTGYNFMQFIAVSVFFVSFCSKSFAQTIVLTPKPQPWTISLILVQESNPYYHFQFDPEFLKGIIVKRNYTQFSLRMALEYTSKTIPFDEP